MWTLYTSLEVFDISTCNSSLRCQHIIQQRIDERRGLSAVQGVDVTLNSYNFFERKCIAAGRESFELDFRSLLPAFIKTGFFFKSNQYWLHRGLECMGQLFTNFSRCLTKPRSMPSSVLPNRLSEHLFLWTMSRDPKANSKMIFIYRGVG